MSAEKEFIKIQRPTAVPLSNEIFRPQRQEGSVATFRLSKAA
jgi:hypothetical protein